MLHFVTEPTRYSLLTQLRDGEATVSELVVAIDGEQTNVSHHLRALREAGVVRSRAVGRERRYRLADPEIERLLGEADATAKELERVTFYTGLQIPMDPAFHGYG